MPKHRHITRKLLLAARRGQVSYRHLAELLLERLAGLCSGCRKEAVAVAAEEIPLAAYRKPVSQAVQIEAHFRRYEEDRKAAPELFALLRELSPEQRLLRIHNSPERFANRALSQDLIAEARACLPHDPQGSLAWARTAEAVADAYASPYYPHQILAIAYQGNAHRALGDFDLARARLYQARNLVERHQVTDLDLGAELHSLLASLCSDENRFDEAVERLESAAALYRILGDDERLARVFMQLGIAHGLLDDLPVALDADRAALALLSPEGNLRLYLSARVNYAFHLTDAGRPAAARDVLDWHADLYAEKADAHTRLRVSWLQARLAAELGDPAAAERGYLQVLEELVRQRQGFDAPLVCLELASLYHRQKRFQELEKIAAQAVELFQAYALHQEALAALFLLRDAARARTLTADAILRVAGFLREAERAPGARFQDPN
ncbi:MAG TPA: tetratricopeptide repeat protein [Thermoanaerobaculia bacterium]|nr:tetratricopeptide repeat protein [Thermoanaerobaculia bacterium]